MRPENGSSFYCKFPKQKFCIVAAEKGKAITVMRNKGRSPLTPAIILQRKDAFLFVTRVDDGPHLD